MSRILASKVVANNVLMPASSISKIRKLWYTSKNLLIIRPKFPNDYYTSWFSFQAAELVKNKAVAEGWNITDLQMNDASRDKVTQTINLGSYEIILHYDHGGDFVMCGQKNNQFENAIDNLNVDLLVGKAASTVSCDTATGLGPLAVANGTRAYLGYHEPHWVFFAWTNQFTEASNAVNYALLEGKTFQEAYNIAFAKHTEIYNQILAGNDVPAAAAMMGNRDCLTLLGDPAAKATGKHSTLDLVHAKTP